MSEMIGSFSFNGIESQSFGLVSKSVKRPLLPPAKEKRVDVGSGSGVHDFPGLEYGLRQVTMRVAYVGKDYYELRARARQIAAWLGAEDWAKLIFVDEKDKYYLAKVTSELDLEPLWEAGTVDIEFDCQPFAYSIAAEHATLSGEGTFTNPGTRRIDYTAPQGSIFTVTLTGASITLNGKTLGYTGSDTVVIDCVEVEAEANGVNVYGDLTGDIDEFLHIIPGVNTFSVDGTAVIDFVPMWL